jgi:hypothetical protein
MIEALIHLKQAAVFLSGKDKDMVTKIILSIENDTKIKEWSDRKCINISKKENGAWESTLKKMILANFYRPLSYDRDKKHKYKECTCGALDRNFDIFYSGISDKKEECTKECLELYELNTSINEHNFELSLRLKDEVFKSINNTDFGDLKDKYVLLLRRSEWNERTELDKALFEIIRTEILSMYQNQNTNLIKQINLNYESSKQQEPVSIHL